MLTFCGFLRLFQDDWPYPMATEGPLDLENEALLLGSEDDIAAIIRDSARIHFIECMMLVHTCPSL